MSVNLNSQNTNNVSNPVSMDSMIDDLEAATKQIHSIKKRFDEMENEVKVSEMVQDQVMIEHGRIKHKKCHRNLHFKKLNSNVTLLPDPITILKHRMFVVRRFSCRVVVLTGK